MKKTIYNLDALVSVIVRDKKVSESLEYKPFKKSFWGNTKEGFYGYECTHYTKEDIENGRYFDYKYLVIDNVAYVRPHVKLIFNGEVSHDREFNTYEEALKWGTEISKKGIKAQLLTDDVEYTTNF